MEGAVLADRLGECDQRAKLDAALDEVSLHVGHDREEHQRIDGPAVDRRRHLRLEQPKRRAEQLARRVDRDAVVLVQQRDLGERDARAAAHARLGRLEHPLEVLDRLLARRVAEVLLVVGRVGVDLRERLEQILIVELRHLGE